MRLRILRHGSHAAVGNAAVYSPPSHLLVNFHGSRARIGQHLLVVTSVPLSPSPRPAPTRPASEPSLLPSHALPLTRSRQLQCREVWGGKPQGHSLWQRAADAVPSPLASSPLRSATPLTSALARHAGVGVWGGSAPSQTARVGRGYATGICLARSYHRSHHRQPSSHPSSHPLVTF